MAPAPILADADDAVLRATERMYFEGLIQRIQARWDVPITKRLPRFITGQASAL